MLSRIFARFIQNWHVPYSHHKDVFQVMRLHAGAS